MVEEATNIAFYTNFLHFSIFQILQCNLLEVPPEKDCVRSCLIAELQSFFDDSKININPIYRVLMLFPSVLHVSGMTRYRVVDIVWILVVVFFSWINKQEEHMLSSVQILTSRCKSIVDN